ncbi:MAG: NAD(P)-binding domain-containing protein, partial [Calditrichaeota bacterium]|nr:NAD(P)-binding domain-containing protein [Calditrichota bacterium]
MKIGILGSGIVGKTLAGGFLKHGYEVMAGSRQPEKLQDWKAEIGPKLQTGNYSETAAFADIIVLAVKGTVAKAVLKLAGIENLSGKTVLDATNPIADAAPVNGVLQFFSSLDQSLMEQLQQLAPKANFVKAFNSVGAHVMVNPKFETRPTMFICGNNEAAKEITKKILDQFGWEVEDMGGTEAARAIEPLCILWCIPGFRENRWTHAF